MASQPPWAQAQTQSSDETQVLTLQNGFPATSPNTLRNTIAIDPNYTLAYAQMWNLSVDTTAVPEHAHRRDVHRHQRHPSGHAAGLQRQQHPGQRRCDSECAGLHLQHLRRQLHLPRRAIAHYRAAPRATCVSAPTIRWASPWTTPAPSAAASRSSRRTTQTWRPSADFLPSTCGTNSAPTIATTCPLASGGGLRAPAGPMPCWATGR